MKWKAIAILGWVLIVFGFLYVLSLAYENQKTFVLFVFLAFGGNMAYDVTKSLVILHPLYQSDWATLCKKGLRFVLHVVLSFAALVTDIFSVLPLHIGLLLWLYFYSCAMFKLAQAEKYYRLMRSGSVA